MTEIDTLKLLYKNKDRWMSTKEIYTEIGVGRTTAIAQLKVLIIKNYVEISLGETEEKHTSYFYRITKMGCDIFEST